VDNRLTKAIKWTFYSVVSLVLKKPNTSETTL